MILNSVNWNVQRTFAQEMIEQWKISYGHSIRKEQVVKKL